MPNAKPTVGTPFNWAHPLSRGLWAYWLLREGSGLTARSGSFGRDRDLALTLPAWVSGDEGAALTLSSTQYGTCGTDGPPNGAITVACRFYFTSAGGTKTLVSRGTGFSFRVNATPNLALRVNEGSTVTGATSMAINRWYDGAFTCDESGNVCIYQNGRLDATGTLTAISTSGNPITVGRRFDGTLTFPGRMQRVTAWSRALSAAEIAAFTADPYAMYPPTSRRAALLSGIAPSINFYTLTAVASAYVESGKAAGLLAARKLPAAASAFAEAGQPAILKAARKVVAAVGAYAEAGQAATFRLGRGLVASAGIFLGSGQAAGFRADRKVAAASGAFLLAGRDATLSPSTVPAARTPRRIFASVSVAAARVDPDQTTVEDA